MSTTVLVNGYLCDLFTLIKHLDDAGDTIPDLPQIGRMTKTAINYLKQEACLALFRSNQIEQGHQRFVQLLLDSPVAWLELSAQLLSEPATTVLLAVIEQHLDTLKPHLIDYQGDCHPWLMILADSKRYLESADPQTDMFYPIIQWMTPDNRFSALSHCLQYRDGPVWIELAHRLIDSTTLNQPSLLDLIFQYCPNPLWIPVAQRLITPETIQQVDQQGWNPLMYCLRYCTDPAWIPLAQQLITPETIKQVNQEGRNPLAYCLQYCTDPAWDLIVQQINVA